MAVVTGTLLLRPVASRGSFAATVPADTPVEEIYKLINEEVSDGAATTFKPRYTAGEYFVENSKLCVKYSIPENIKIISVSNVTSVVRKTMNTVNVCFCKYLDGDRLTPLSHYWTLGAGSTDYEIMSDDKDSLDTNNGSAWTDELSNAIAEALNNDDFALGYSTSNAKGVEITQTYIEVDCTYEEAGTPLYFKQNGEWAELSGNVYQKANGEWLEADVSVLSGEFPVEEVAI